MPYQRFVHDFPKLDAGREARLRFRNWSLVTCLGIGYCFARFTVSDNQMNNWWYNRPDLKPFPAMVNQEHLDAQEVGHTKDTMMRHHYNSYRAAKRSEDTKRSSLYRYFFPLSADYSVKASPFAHSATDLYDARKSNFASYSNHFDDHMQD